MKLLIPLDGSSGSETALSELKRAGMPRRVEALVLSVADVILPSSAATDPAGPQGMAEQMDKARARAMEAVDQARAVAARGKQKVKTDFPDWTVSAEAFADSPAWGVVRKAEEWKADLIVVGSHNRSALGRLMLGSLSHAPRSASRAVPLARKAHRFT